MPSDTDTGSQEASMHFEKESLVDIFWSFLSFLGVLAATGVLALGVRLSIGKW